MEQQLLLDGSDVAAQRMEQDLSALLDTLHLIGRELGLTGDRVLVLDAVRACVMERRELRRQLAEARRQLASGPMVCRTCRNHLPRCTLNQECVRQGEGCGFWER